MKYLRPAQTAVISHYIQICLYHPAFIHSSIASCCIYPVIHPPHHCSQTKYTFLQLRHKYSHRNTGITITLLESSRECQWITTTICNIAQLLQLSGFSTENRTFAAARHVPLGSKYTKNAFVAQVLPWISLGQLSAPADP